MRERAAGESRLEGKTALVLVLTVAGTLITAEHLRRRRTQQSNKIALLGADAFPDVSTGLTTIVFIVPAARQYVTVEP